MAFDPDALLDVLVCPGCKSKLVYHEDSFVCTDAGCRLSYEVRDDIPVMLVDDATVLSEADWSGIVSPESSNGDSSS